MRTPGLSFARGKAALGASLAFLVIVSTASAAGITVLGDRGNRLATDERAATMDLYALGSRLEQARADLGRMGARIAALDAERRAVRLELSAARRTLVIAQRRLGGQVRVLYEHDQPDVLAVILGAQSLDELVNGLDGLSRAAGANSALVDQARDAQDRVSRLSRTLADRRRALEQLVSAARARTQDLLRAQAEREGYIAGLRRQARLTGAQIASAETQAHAAQASSQTATMVAESSTGIASIAAQSLLPRPEDPAGRPVSGRRLTVLATAYSLPGSTASGLPTGPGIVAVDPTVIPLGTRMFIPGYGSGIAADVGTAVTGLRIDVWFPRLAQAQAWGLRQVTITLR